ncbi:hypothetical protein [Acetobacter sp. LMG 32666]|uniref:hypothetical protein n=1 Tax=Acetobacter sp. LMG 32666 TaxID=2959295 RepID=UPI0030C88429
MLDRLTSMKVFAKAVELGSCAAAAQHLTLSPQMVKKRRAILIPALISALAMPALARDQTPPPAMLPDPPRGYSVLTQETLLTGHPQRRFEIVALGRDDEAPHGEASARPLLIFEQRGDRFVQIARNDQVIFKADEGGQCDPFLDGYDGIVVTGRFFTVQNGVACGQHWTDFITFRLDDRFGFVFDNERAESWSLHATHGTADDGELMRDRPQSIRRDKPGHITTFSDWHREH